MGYFSELSIDMQMHERCEPSYPSPEQQLRWRIEDLIIRITDYGIQIPPMDIILSYASKSHSYVLPECLNNPRDMLVALANAYNRLTEYANEYNAYKPVEELPRNDNKIEQVTFFDFSGLMNYVPAIA